MTTPGPIAAQRGKDGRLHLRVLSAATPDLRPNKDGSPWYARTLRITTAHGNDRRRWRHNTPNDTRWC